MNNGDLAYADYDDWKGWANDGFMVLSSRSSAYYDEVLGRRDLVRKNVLDIGFGQGEVLAWAKAAGADVYGTEVSERGRAQASERGLHVLPTDLTDAPVALHGTFTLITAFDVLEHLDRSQIVNMLAAVAKLLTANGHFVARFPNGQGPLGRIYQAGDATHISTLSGPLIAQMVRGSSLVLESVKEDEPVAFGSFGQKAKTTLRRAIRRCFSKILLFAYGFDAPVGPNVIVTFRKADGVASTTN